MASAARLAANRTNAARSTGPADTSRTRFNGLQHGLAGKQTVVAGENQSDYDSFRDRFVTELAPGSENERVLADRIVAAAWRLQRFVRVEAAFFNNRIDAYCEENPGAEPETAMANLFVDPAEAARMRLFMRYQTAVQREYDKARSEYQKAREERARQSYEQALVARMNQSATETEETEEPSFGFASQSETEPRAMAAGFTLGTETAPAATPAG